MSRSSSTAIRWSILGLFVALLAALTAPAIVPASADAQGTDDPAASLVVSEPIADQSFRTVAVSLQGGNVGLAALSGDLQYDAEAINVISCEVSEAGACNASGAGVVRMSVFNLSGLRDNNQLLTVNFEVVPGATGSSTFTFDIETAVNFAALELPDIEVAPLDFVMVEPTFGSLTGDVVAADSQTGLFAIDVCAVSTANAAETCTTSTGLGTWRLDDLAVGAYTVAISDPAKVYGSASLAAAVTADTITTGLDASLDYYTEPVAEEDADDAGSDADADTDAGDTTSAPPVAVEPQVTKVFEASIAGHISDLETATPLEGLTVCATQPLVLYQSCGTTDAGGFYALADLSAGNYWVTVVDPLGQYEDAPVELVGVVGDTSVRDGVKIQLRRING